MMTELRLLKIFKGSNNFCNENDDYKLLISQEEFELPSYDLRYLHWHGYPLETLPPNFQAENLVELNMPYSCIKELRKRNMV